MWKEGEIHKGWVIKPQIFREPLFYIYLNYTQYKLVYKYMHTPTNQKQKYMELVHMAWQHKTRK